MTTGCYNLQILCRSNFMKAELGEGGGTGHILNVTICITKHDRCLMFMNSEARISSNLFCVT